MLVMMLVMMLMTTLKVITIVTIIRYYGDIVITIMIICQHHDSKDSCSFDRVVETVEGNDAGSIIGPAVVGIDD